MPTQLGARPPFRWEGMPGFGAEDFEIRLIYPYGEVVFSLRDARSGRAKEHGVFRFSDHVLISNAAKTHDLRTTRRPLRRSVTRGQQLSLGRVRRSRTERETRLRRQVLKNSHRCVRDRGPSSLLGVRLGSPSAEASPW